MTTWEVTAEALNFREKPSLNARILRTLPRGTSGTLISKSADGDWLKMDVGGAIGWCWENTMKAVNNPEDTTFASAVASICSILDHSVIAQYRWKQRGQAPSAYLRGMGLAYLLAQSKLSSEPMANTMAAPWDGENKNDILHFSTNDFSLTGLDNSGSDQDRLRHLFSLLIGLGMRESSGRWCEGRDQTVANQTADSAESGLFQTSWDIRYTTPAAKELLRIYQQREDKFAPIFKTDIHPVEGDLEIIGTGDGATYQRVAKEKPTFSVFLAALGLRSNCRHWGPVIRHEAEIRAEADEYLQTIANHARAQNLYTVLTT
jgi:hypothetical protein